MGSCSPLPLLKSFQCICIIHSLSCLLFISINLWVMHFMNGMLLIPRLHLAFQGSEVPLGMFWISISCPWCVTNSTHLQSARKPESIKYRKSLHRSLINLYKTSFKRRESFCPAFQDKYFGFSPLGQLYNSNARWKILNYQIKFNQV